MKRSPMPYSTKPMTRTPFQRKTPMARGVTRIKPRSRPRAPKVEREYMGSVAALGCVVCRNLGYGISPAEVHHVRYLAGGGQRSGNLDTIPLCPWHHRLGGHGVAFHAGPKTFEENYGSEEDLLNQTRADLGLREAA